MVRVVARDIAADAFPDAVLQDHAITFAVPGAEQRAVLEKVWALGGEVVSVNPVRRSLEEIFLEVTAEGSSQAATREAR